MDHDGTTDPPPRAGDASLIYAGLRRGDSVCHFMLDAMMPVGSESSAATDHGQLNLLAPPNAPTSLKLIFVLFIIEFSTSFPLPASSSLNIPFSHR